MLFVVGMMETFRTETDILRPERRWRCEHTPTASITKRNWVGLPKQELLQKSL